jgi:hypothetical protein
VRLYLERVEEFQLGQSKKVFQWADYEVAKYSHCKNVTSL